MLGRVILFIILINPIFIYAIHDSFTEKARGQTAFPILKSPVSPFFYSVGGGGSAVLKEDNIFLNPAAMYSLNSKSFSLSFHKDSVESARSDIFFITRKAKTVYGISISYIDYGDFLKLDENANELGFFSPYDLVLSASTSFGTFRERFGVRLKYLFSNMIYERSSAFALDTGFLVSGKTSSLSLLVRNIGPSPEIGGKHYSLPLEFSAGFSYLYSQSLKGIFDLRFPLDNKTYATCGIEYHTSLDNFNFYLRAGANTLNFREIGWGGILNGGFGIEYSGFGVDYSFTPVSNIDSIHRVLFKYSFGEVKDKREEEYRFREFVAKKISLKKKIAVFPFSYDDSSYSDVVANSIEERLMEKKHAVISRLDPIYISNSKSVYQNEFDIIAAAEDMGADYAVWGRIIKKDDVKAEFKVFVISVSEKKKYEYSLISNIYDVRNIALKISDEISSIVK